MSDRTKRVEAASDVVARILADAGIPVPDSLDEIMRDDTVARVDNEPTRRDRLRARMLELGWPRRAVEWADAAVETDAVRVTRRWAGRGSIVLAGPKGTGKTVAAAWHALNSERGEAFRFVRAAMLVRVGRFGDEWSGFLTARSLCVDDLGAEYADVKGSFVSDLDELVDTFYADRRTLIVTTNLDGKEFRSRYGARVTDRIRECAEWASIGGESMRARDDEAPPWEE